ncbi:extracellular solute-binding protein [Microlunatus soli]|uniref:Putative aldouronate transport system substrate-binding protein n=1 Tax=Microlunatus soli TaxID=630515 RepID=A0A1H2AED1_9ACTN|nr:extracellular solute-binding protein [Microlunatus soli]SDT44290.1 putative aldouronate transport system substrate-binding protein [Microlunatus soli]
MSAFSALPLIDRRKLLIGAGGTALVAGGLSGCSSSKAETNSASTNQSVKLPSYIPIEGAKPDFPGTTEGVEPAYKLFPTERKKTVPEKPGTGKDTITGMVINYATVPPGVSKNPFWQGLNERLGIDLKLQITPNADYIQKFSTVIAGNELPDMMLTQVVANFPSLLEKRFSPLDEYLGGDAVKDYPNLANIPTQVWKSVIYNGKIFGLPLPRGLIGTYNFIRADRFKEAGVSTEPKSLAELLDAGKALTDPKKRRWAYSMIGQPRALLARMNEEPNVWRNEGGTFTHAYETDAYKRSVSDLIAMWKSGVMHPDAFNPQQPFKELFAAGNIAINASDGYTGFNSYQSTGAASEGFELGLMPVYKRDGGELAPWALGSGSFGMASIKKMDAERVKLCLRLANYLAAPFGSEEYYYLSYGEEGVDHKVDKAGNPTLTDSGKVNVAIPMRYLGDGPKASYSPGRPQDAKKQHDYQSMEVPHGVANPAIGLFSNAQATKNATADKAFLDSVNEIIQGRKPYSGFGDVLSTWKSAVGDEMRKEYQDQLQKKGSGDK